MTAEQHSSVGWADFEVVLILHVCKNAIKIGVLVKVQVSSRPSFSLFTLLQQI